jgi:hypothetical protein
MLFNRYLAPISMFANAALVLAIAVVFYYGFTQIQLQKSYPFIHISKFPLFFGIAVFGYISSPLSPLLVA